MSRETLPARAPAASPDAGAGARFTSRQAFERRLKAAGTRAAGGVPHALFVIHLERFADAVRRCGPDAEVALNGLCKHIVDEQVGPTTGPCRLALGRFALVKDRCLPGEALVLARRALHALEGGTFRWKGLSFRLGVSISIVELGCEAGGASPLERAIGACDAAVRLGNDGILVLTGNADEQRHIEREVHWREHIREVLG